MNPLSGNFRLCKSAQHTFCPLVIGLKSANLDRSVREEQDRSSLWGKLDPARGLQSGSAKDQGHLFSLAPLTARDWRLLTFAFVRGELEPKSFLRVRNSVHDGHRNIELAIAKSADSDCGDRPKPFHYPKITRWHC
jgi:hypothetical protein